MRVCAAGLVAGALVALLILAVGVTLAAYLAIAGALLAIVWGGVDYVRSHGRNRRHG